ncbi:hypothetical protein P378_16175 [Desulforamulus profundi]|uniref:Uncharacterized protein n=1 Tax=Desulforamulus profundi TaxID=1383067 RepID=A0A2C6LGY8_9FIRM|nr:hypothetical protein [Desulforamulus profundi]PHJ37490.1 hypothetical protein P378_16175 [Desulforamulus profundi]
MYCYTYLTSLECGLREVYLWVKLSSEHPVFFDKRCQLLEY